MSLDKEKHDKAELDHKFKLLKDNFKEKDDEHEEEISDMQETF